MGTKTPGYGAGGKQGTKGDTGATGAASTVAGPKGEKGDTGAAGSNASATPLGTALPKALGTAAAGTSVNASREDHVHPANLQLVGNVIVTETVAVSLALGMKRMTLPLTGIVMADMGKLVVVPNGTSTTGCEVQNAYPAAANSVSIGYFTPSLGLLATYTIPCSVYRVV